MSNGPGRSKPSDRQSALLPDGLRDVLPPQAAHETAVVAGLMRVFESYGYDQVEPPMVEFEESLLRGAGAATAPETFRLMDPVSQRMMGVRADMTVQVARIASTRLANSPRPLRLCYAGQTLRVRGGQLRPERQVTQAGCELIGCAAPDADAEAIVLAAEALRAVGIEDLSVDISMPTVVRSVCAQLLDGEFLDAAGVETARAALDRKDAAAVAALGGRAAELLGGLLASVGSAERALDGLRALKLDGAAATERERLDGVLALVRAAMPGLDVTIDPVEHRGFEYQTGLSFTLFARRARGELGRGGRYETGVDGEGATGFSLYLDSVLRGLPDAVSQPRVYLVHGASPLAATSLRAMGHSVRRGLEREDDPQAEARRLGCEFIAGVDGDDETALVSV